MEWGKENGRRFPWRETNDIYNILISEIMLHRTKADQVLNIYNDFLRKYKDFESIVESGPEAIKKDMKSLGLSWRSELLYSMSKEILEKYDGKIPCDKDQLMKLPGIGNYISSAILCFGYNIPVPTLDTNIVRVIGRVYNLRINDYSRKSKKYREIMLDLILHGEPRKFSLYLIDFASIICKPKCMDECKKCPLNKLCAHYLD